jgi:tetratricopeptide (TPR) repeat protein
MIRCVIHIILFIIAVPAVAQRENDILQQANDLYRKKEFSKAEEVYKQLVSEAPRNAKALYNLANTQYQLGKEKEAIENCGKALLADANDALTQKILYNRGTIFARQKDYQKAAEDLKASLKLKPDDEDARQNLQRVLNEMKKQQQQQKNKQQDEKKKNDDKDKKNVPPPKLSKQQVEQLLKSAEEQEKQVQEKLQKQLKASDKKNMKDW